jgi:hypothetical protein
LPPQRSKKASTIYKSLRKGNHLFDVRKGIPQRRQQTPRGAGNSL